MSSFRVLRFSFATVLIVAIPMITSVSGVAGEITMLVDDFSDADASSLGTPRLFIDDTSAGGATQARQEITDGVLSVTGVLSPPRGQPGWASAVLLLKPDGQPADIGSFDGVSLKLRIRSGNLSLSVNSTEVDNFDYHSAQVVVPTDGEFHEVRLSFESLRRAWSSQTDLNLESIASLSIVAFGMRKGPVDFEVDEIGFY